MTLIQIELSIAVIAFTIAIIILAYILKVNRSKRPNVVNIKRHTKNPIMSPQTHNEWETVGTFNPAAIQDKSGRVHLLYRAIGSDGVSRIGYASSKDGLNIDERLTYPVFAMLKPRQNIVQEMPVDLKKIDPIMYPSGGSWGGCEDPRLVHIDDKIYMTFNAFDGWDFIRIGVSIIKADDFFEKKWKWSKPFFISSKDKINKNWLIFPEKIKGKFAILHTIVPEIKIEYVDNINATMKEIDSPRKHGPQPGRIDFWDNMIRGAGPPPIKTDKGWLVLYHAMSKDEPHIGYKMGALLLDINDPKNVIARSPAPILVPNEWYENDWKPGVVYACGATIKDNILYVYYGGGDKHICVAHTPIDKMLEWLLKYGRI
ncbi:MAG: hypothetical protein WCW03_02690 [Candidatus Paceibacterota bacterium]|jgi:predicted GH43/DUF377 family glycosyl hydrolase